MLGNWTNESQLGGKVMAMNYRNITARLGVDELSPPFKDVSVISGEGLQLRLVDKYYYSDAQVPCYEFLMVVDGQEAGTFCVRIETDFEKVREVGNVGIEANRRFYGHDLPSRATSALLPFFKEHGIHSILITGRKGKGAISRACEQLTARYLDTIDSSELGVEMERFVLDF
jgi:predicted acetyltransferase